MLLRWRDTWQNAWRYLCKRWTKLRSGKLQKKWGKEEEKGGHGWNSTDCFRFEGEGDREDKKRLDRPKQDSGQSHAHATMYLLPFPHSLSPCLTHGNKLQSSCIIASMWKWICQLDRTGGGTSAGRAEERLGDENLTGKKGTIPCCSIGTIGIGKHNTTTKVWKSKGRTRKTFSNMPGLSLWLSEISQIVLSISLQTHWTNLIILVSLLLFFTLLPKPHF